MPIIMKQRLNFRFAIVAEFRGAIAPTSAKIVRLAFSLTRLSYTGKWIFRNMGFRLIFFLDLIEVADSAKGLPCKILEAYLTNRSWRSNFCLEPSSSCRVVETYVKV